VATDGVAFIAEVVIVLASAGFVASDIAKAVTACSIQPPASPTDGARYRDTTNNAVYLTLDDILRHVPDPQNYNNLFIDCNGITDVPNVDDFTLGPDITQGASLVNGGPDGKVYLLLEGGKRWITSRDVFTKFYFSDSAIKTLTPDELNQIPDGQQIL